MYKYNKCTYNIANLFVVFLSLILPVQREKQQNDDYKQYSSTP